MGFAREGNVFLDEASFCGGENHKIMFYVISLNYCQHANIFLVLWTIYKLFIFGLLVHWTWPNLKKIFGFSENFTKIAKIKWQFKKRKRSSFYLLLFEGKLQKMKKWWEGEIISDWWKDCGLRQIKFQHFLSDC